MRVLVTGGAGFIGSHLVTRAASRRASTCASSTTSERPQVENLAGIARDIELVRGRSARREPARARCLRRRRRLPPGGGAVRAAQRRGAGAHPRRERDRHARRCSRPRARAGVAPLRLRRLVRRPTATPELPKREDMPADPRSPYALQKSRARSTAGCTRASTASRPSRCATSTCSGRARIRTASTPPWCRASPPRCLRGQRDRDLRRRRADARLHVRRRRRARQPARPREAPRRRARRQRRRRPPHEPERAARGRSPEHRRDARRRRATSRRAPATCATASPT